MPLRGTTFNGGDVRARARTVAMPPSRLHFRSTTTAEAGTRGIKRFRRVLRDMRRAALWIMGVRVRSGGSPSPHAAPFAVRPAPGACGAAEPRPDAKTRREDGTLDSDTK